MGIFSKKNKEPYIINIDEVQNEEQREWIKGIFNIFDECEIPDYVCFVDPLENNEIYFSFNFKVVNEAGFKEAFWGSQLDDIELLHLEFNHINNREAWIDTEIRGWLDRKANGEYVPEAAKLVESAEAGADVMSAVFNKLVDYSKEHSYREVFPKGLEKNKNKSR